MTNDEDAGADLQLALRAAMSGQPESRSNQASHAVIGAAIEVHRILGPGYQESIYQLALEEELRLRAIPFQRQVPYAVDYKGIKVGSFRFDLIVDQCLLVELKHVAAIANLHISQVVGYLKCTGLDLALILNFMSPTLKAGIKRVVAPH